MSVSVIIPVYNHQELVAEVMRLGGVARQYQFEVIFSRFFPGDR